MNTKHGLGKVAVLYGGKSAEREVSIMSGEGVCQALIKKGVDAHLFDTGTKDLCQLASQGFDAAFIALHGRYGEDGTIQGALELIQIPYTGSGPMASSLSMDKQMTKKIWHFEGLPTPTSMPITHETDLGELVEKLGLPLIIKPAREGSTIGITKVESMEQLKPACDLALDYDNSAMAEKFIKGRELTVPLIGSGKNAKALPIIEIIAPDGNYDYEHKYISNDTQYICPADLDETLTKQIQDIALQSYLTLDCDGWARADLMLDENNKPWLLEINTSPGMTSHSLVPMSAKAVGMDYETLCLEILKLASCKVNAVTKKD